ncbi:MAG: DUF423 domain-containing protein, partial [Bdellovibrionota bacterium]
MSRWIVMGSISGFLSVALGAFAAHALSARLGPRELEIFKTGTQYQFYHALALILFGISMAGPLRGESHVTGWAFVVGTIIFSGSLYILALTGIKAWGAVTPIGGVAFLVGWASF